MKVLVLTTQYLPHIGGSELAIANLTKRLPHITFDIVTSGFGGKWLLPITGFFKAVGKKYDYIHVFQASYAGGAGWFLKLCFPKIPLIVSLQEGKDLDKQSWFVRRFRDVILRKADVITAISNYLLDYAKKINPKAKHVLLPNGVDLKMFAVSVSRDPRLVITSSRLVPKNGIDILIRAMAYLPDYKLDIIGDGPLRKELEDLVEELGIKERVIFSGAVAYHALPERLARAYVFVRPSRSEGLGIAFLDAFASGVPVVATPVGGIPDFLKDYETGLFCKVDDPQSVADAVGELLKNDVLRKKITENARKLVEEKYDWDLLAKQYYEIISHHSSI